MKPSSFSSDGTQLRCDNGLENEMLEFKHYTVDILYLVRCAHFFLKTIDHINDFCANDRCTVRKAKATWPLKFSINAATLLTIHTVKTICKTKDSQYDVQSLFGEQQCSNFYDLQTISSTVIRWNASYGILI